MLKYNEIDENGKLTPVVKIDSGGSKDERMKKGMKDHAKKAAEFRVKMLNGAGEIALRDELMFNGKEISGKLK